MFFDRTTQNKSQGWHAAKSAACKNRARKLNEKLDDIETLSARKAESKRRKKQRGKIKRQLAAQKKAERKSQRMMDYAPAIKICLSDAAQSLAQKATTRVPQQAVSSTPSTPQPAFSKEAILLLALTLAFTTGFAAYACKLVDRAITSQAEQQAARPSAEHQRVGPPALRMN